MAELEILEALVSFFCPTSDSASACREFIQNHQVLPPIGPLFYFLLFPLVFTILFVYILSGTILQGGQKVKWMQMLIGITVFIFIIISGWYPIMLVLSEVWYIAIILLFGVWYFIGRHKGGGGGGSGGGGERGKMPGISGAMWPLMKIKSERDDIKLARSSLNMANILIEEIKEKKKERSAENMREIEEALRTAQNTVNTLLLNPLHSTKAMELQNAINNLEKKSKKL